MFVDITSFFCVSGRINGHLVALKVIHMKTEEGIPFTAIREGTATTQHTQPRYKSAYTHAKGSGLWRVCVVHNLE